MLDVFLNRALPYVLEKDFSLNLETADPARLTEESLWHLSVSASALPLKKINTIT